MVQTPKGEGWGLPLTFQRIPTPLLSPAHRRLPPAPGRIYSDLFRPVLRARFFMPKMPPRGGWAILRFQERQNVLWLCVADDLNKS